jgi:beta-lactamase superfamily II metal-dependent hydrolase
MPAAPEFIVFNVGQGSANLLRFADGRVLVFDAGPRALGPLHQYLRSYPPNSIECLLLSHNDRDHVAGLEQLLEEHNSIIKRLYLLEDRDRDKDHVFDLIQQQVESNLIVRPRLAVIDDLGKPKRLFFDQATGTAVHIMFPDFIANRYARNSRSPNRTSTIVRIKRGGSAIYYSSDSTLDSWRDVADHNSDLPFEGGVVVMPHHGAELYRNADGDDIRWFLAKAGKPDEAIFSVGSGNQHGHPVPSVISTLRDASVGIACTQITTNCEKALHTGFNVLGYDAVDPANPTHRLGCSCFGDVVVRLHPQGAKIIKRSAHSELVRTKVANPLCDLRVLET